MGASINTLLMGRLRGAIPDALVPKLFTTLRGYTRAQLRADLSAGVIVGVVALPLAIAFAIASGVTPDHGLYTAIIAGFLISALGGSRVQIGGPTGAFVVVVYGIVQKYGIDGLTVATIMAGVVLIAFGIARFGTVIKFIPFPVILGFTSGIAVIIFSSQVKDLLGLQMGAVPANFLEKWVAYSTHAHGLAWPAVAVSGGTLAILLLWPRISRRVPSPFVALIAATAAVQLFHIPVETIGSRFGAIPSSFPSPHWPAVSLHTITELAAPAFAIALLGAIESLLSAVVSDGMIGGRNRSDAELVAQGVANVVAPFFGGIPATGAIARTATNVKNGGRTPIAGMTHAVTLLLITLVFGRLASLIPMACLAGILTVVAFQMSEWRTFRAELRSPRGDVAVLLVTFFLTVFFDLTIAIEVGMVLAAFLFMRRMAGSTAVRMLSAEALVEEIAAGDAPGPVEGGVDDEAVAVAGGGMPVEPGGERASPSGRSKPIEEAPPLPREGTGIIPKGVQVFEIAGPLFFGAASTFKDAISRVGKSPTVLIIRMGKVPVIDSTGLRTLADVVHRSRRDGTLVIISELHPQPSTTLRRSTVIDDVGEENLTPTLSAALTLAREHLNALATLQSSRRTSR